MSSESAPDGDGRPRSPRPAGDGVVIAPMRRRHLRAVTAIERSSNPHPWSHDLFAGELAMPTSRLWVVARVGRTVVGFAGLMVTLDEAHITNLGVHPDHRRREIASRLLLALFHGALARGVRDITLEVRVSNVGARELYRGFGFTPGGLRPGYYRDNGEDALVMWANDIDSPRRLRRLRTRAAELSSALRMEPALERDPRLEPGAADEVGSPSVGGGAP